MNMYALGMIHFVVQDLENLLEKCNTYEVAIKVEGSVKLFSSSQIVVPSKIKVNNQCFQ